MESLSRAAFLFLCLGKIGLVITLQIHFIVATTQQNIQGDVMNNEQKLKEQIKRLRMRNKDLNERLRGALHIIDGYKIDIAELRGVIRTRV